MKGNGGGELEVKRRRGRAEGRIREEERDLKLIKCMYCLLHYYPPPVPVHTITALIHCDVVIRHS